MSKRKIDETVTQARQAKAKKAREKAGLETTDAKPTVAEFLASEGHPEAAAVAAQHAHDADAPETTDTKTRGLAVVAPTASDAPTDGPAENLVVFAFRLTPEERDAIHKAAGAGKASKFVRALATHAARGDVKTVTAMVEAVRTSVAP